MRDDECPRRRLQYDDDDERPRRRRQDEDDYDLQVRIRTPTPPRANWPLILSAAGGGALFLAGATVGIILLASGQSGQKSPEAAAAAAPGLSHDDVLKEKVEILREFSKQIKTAQPHESVARRVAPRIEDLAARAEKLKKLADGLPRIPPAQEEELLKKYGQQVRDARSQLKMAVRNDLNYDEPAWKAAMGKFYPLWPWLERLSAGNDHDAIVKHAVELMDDLSKLLDSDGPDEFGFRGLPAGQRILQEANDLDNLRRQFDGLARLSPADRDELMKKNGERIRTAVARANRAFATAREKSHPNHRELLDHMRQMYEAAAKRFQTQEP